MNLEWNWKVENYSRQAEYMDSVSIIVDMNVSGKCSRGYCLYVYINACHDNRISKCLDSCIIDGGESTYYSINLTLCIFKGLCD